MFTKKKKKIVHVCPSTSLPVPKVEKWERKYESKLKPDSQQQPSTNVNILSTSNWKKEEKKGKKDRKKTERSKQTNQEINNDKAFF